MRFERISIMAAIMWEILALVVGIVLLIATLFILAPHTWLWYLVLWLLGAIYIAVAFVYIPYLYLNTEFAVTSAAVIYKKGVIFPSTQILYRDRIVFVTVYDNPLTPFLHVSSLAVSAAGGNMTILFMNTDRARQIAGLLAKEKISKSKK